MQWGMDVKWVDEIRYRFAQRRRACRQIGFLYGHRATSLSLRGFGVYTIAPISPLVAYKCGSGGDTRRLKCFFTVGHRCYLSFRAHRSHRKPTGTTRQPLPPTASTQFTASSRNPSQISREKSFAWHMSIPCPLLLLHFSLL